MRATEILDAAMAAMGAPEDLAAVERITAHARCTSPHGAYETAVDSWRDGRLSFKQSWPDREPFVALIDNAGAHALDPETGETRALEPELVAMIRAHEFQMIPLTLSDRFSRMTVAGSETFEGAECLKIEAVDRLDRPCAIYFHEDTHLWAGMVMENPVGEEGETVRVVIVEWREMGSARLPSRVEIRDGSGEYTLDFHRIELNRTDESG